MDLQAQLHQQHKARRQAWCAAAVQEPVAIDACAATERAEVLSREEALERAAADARAAEEASYWNKWDTAMADARERLRGVFRHNEIIREVSWRHGVTVSEIKSESRSRRKVDARQEAAYRLVAETTLSYPQIGALLGGRDHTTIMHGVRTHARRNQLFVPRGLLKEQAVQS